MGPFLSGLNLFPVKSLAGMAVEAAQVEKCGLAGDRRWILVEAKPVEPREPVHPMLSQRSHPRMALIRAMLTSDGLLLSTDLPMGPTHPQSLKLPLLPDPNQQRARVKIFGDLTCGRWVSPTVDDWLSVALGSDVRLLIADDQQDRKVEPGYADPAERVVYADGYPFLLFNQSSLDALSHACGRQLDHRRFRPTLVVSGAKAFAEDAWRRIRIGELEFELVKPCGRCTITDVNPDTGGRLWEESGEYGPMADLIKYRVPRSDTFMGGFPAGFFTRPEMKNLVNKPLFGQNAVVSRSGHLEVGMRVEVLQEW